mmetsp:Transcript_83019/g.220242  ORF Transcript_83019/g.220242 Transcript_83019/m.220242 type:complete len:210 (-) Transcript_83019:630-1259(-)
MDPLPHLQPDKPVLEARLPMLLLVLDLPVQGAARAHQSPPPGRVAALRGIEQQERQDRHVPHRAVERPLQVEGHRIASSLFLYLAAVPSELRVSPTREVAGFRRLPRLARQLGLSGHSPERPPERPAKASAHSQARRQGRHAKNAEKKPHHCTKISAVGWRGMLAWLANVNRQGRSGQVHVDSAAAVCEVPDQVHLPLEGLEVLRLLCD